MVEPDFLASRRQLRRSRLLDALEMPREGVNVRLNRDRLLERLVNYADSPAVEFGTLSEGIVDTVISLAVAEIDESALDSVEVVLPCIGVLAADGQFARLRLLAKRLEELARRVDVERPLLALALSAFSHALQFEERRALVSIEESISNGELQRSELLGRSEDKMMDLLIVAALRSALSGSDSTFVERARSVAIQAQDGLALSFLDAILRWRDAANKSNSLTVLRSSDPSFFDERLSGYVEQRGIGALFPAQIKAIEAGATTDKNLVVSLPTSSGKTFLAELRIAASMTRNQGSRAIYIAPYRLVARQVERSMTRGLRPLGLSVRDIGGAYEAAPGEFRNSELTDVSICTPEHLDALLRLTTIESDDGAKARQLFESCALLVFDELQLIGRMGRGPNFELIVTRLRSKYPQIQYLGLAAASQGIDEVALWLTDDSVVSGAMRPTGTLEIVWEKDGTLRQRVEPNPTIVGQIPRIDPRKDASLLIKRLTRRYSPVLAVETRRSFAEGLASKIVEIDASGGAEWRRSLSPPQNESLNESIEEIRGIIGSEHPLTRYMEVGVAFHHAGLPTKVLQHVEKLAAESLLRVVSATTTVAEGADLPFRAVVIPHLNFPGESNKLDRDLYLNIIGRAGRANVSMEGLVFVLNSDAPTLRHLIRQSLWNPTASDRVRGRLAQISSSPSSPGAWKAFNETQSQVLGWLGDGQSYIDNQALAFAEQTLSWAQGTHGDQIAIVGMITDALEDIEARGFSVAASPHQLTSRGRNARLTGLSVPSVLRLEGAVDGVSSGLLSELVGVTSISQESAESIARLLFEAIEVAEHGLWFRKNHSASDASRVAALLKLASGESDFMKSTEEYAADIRIVTSWLMGQTYLGISQVAPIYSSAQSLFGGNDDSKRISDVTEYLSSLLYPAGWVWSGIRVLAGQLGESLPAFIRRSIEFGVPSESATRLVADELVTRGGALAVAEIAGSRWEQVVGWIKSDSRERIEALGLTRLDTARLVALHERLSDVGMD